MKNGFNGMSDGQLISNFVESEGEYFIEFLDGAYYKVPISEDNKQSLINIMLNQATERNNSDALKNAKTKRVKTIIAICAEAIASAAMIIITQKSETNIEKIVSTILASIAGIGVIISGVKYRLNNSEIEELKKYGIYLSIRDRLEACNDPNLFNGVPEKADVLNINTLDNYSLRDLQMIRDNLERSSQLYSHFNMNYNSRTQKN